MSNPNIHEISIPAGPTTNGIVDLGELSLVELQRKKGGFEEELRALGGVLESVGLDMLLEDGMEERQEADETVAWRRYEHALVDAGWVSEGGFGCCSEYVSAYYLSAHYSTNATGR
jgi:hypothetical protein